MSATANMSAPASAKASEPSDATGAAAPLAASGDGVVGAGVDCVVLGVSVTTVILVDGEEPAGVVVTSTVVLSGVVAGVEEFVYIVVFMIGPPGLTDVVPNGVE